MERERESACMSELLSQKSSCTCHRSRDTLREGGMERERERIERGRAVAVTH